MTVVLRRLDGDVLEPVGKIRDGDVVEGDLSDLFVDGPPGEQELLDRFDGPTLFAAKMDDAEGAGRDGPLSHIPKVPDDPDRLTRPMLQEIVRWKVGQVAEESDDVEISNDLSVQFETDGSGQAQQAEAGEFTRHFNPSLHPRDPDTGKFVERPYDIDLDQTTLDSTPTPQLLQFLSDEGEPVDDWIASDSMSIDGIPDEADDLDTARTILQESDDVDEDALGVPKPDQSKAMTGGRGLDVPDSAYEQAEAAIDMASSQVSGTENILQADFATKMVKGRRAGAYADKTGEVEAEPYPILDKNEPKIPDLLRDALKDQSGLDFNKVERAIEDLDHMKGDSYSNPGKTFEVALQEVTGAAGDPRNDELETHGRASDEDYQDAVAAVTALSQKVVENLHDDDETLYRGLQEFGGAQLARGFLTTEPEGTTFRFDENVMANYTPANNVADDFASTFVVQRDANAADVAHASDNVLGNKSSFRREGEIALHTGDAEVRYEDIRIDGTQVTLDGLTQDPSDMDNEEMLPLNDLLKAVQGSEKVDMPTADEIPQGMIDWLEDFVREANSGPGISPIEQSTSAFGPDKSPKDLLQEILGEDRYEALANGEA